MLRDKVVIVTGGAGLIGKEFAKTIIDNSGTAVIADINEAAAKLGISTRTIRRMIKQYEEDLRTEHVEEVIQLTVEKLMVSLTDIKRIRAPRKSTS